MKKICLMAFAALLLISCNNSQQKENTATVQSTNTTADNTVKKTFDNAESSDPNNCIVGKYSIDNGNQDTYILEIKNDETVVLYLARDASLKCYGSWKKTANMKYALIKFDDIAPNVWDKVNVQYIPLRYPAMVEGWIYLNSSAYGAKNPEKRWICKRID